MTKRRALFFLALDALRPSSSGERAPWAALGLATTDNGLLGRDDLLSIGEEVLRDEPPPTPLKLPHTIKRVAIGYHGHYMRQVTLRHERTEVGPS